MSIPFRTSFGDLIKYVSNYVSIKIQKHSLMSDINPLPLLSRISKTMHDMFRTLGLNAFYTPGDQEFNQETLFLPLSDKVQNGGLSIEAITLKKKSQNMFLGYTCRGDQQQRESCFKGGFAMTMTMIIELKGGTLQGSEVWEFGDGLELLNISM